MKVTWEPADIVPGRIVGSDRRTERWMIGYDYQGDDDKRYTLNSLEDGLIAHHASKEALAALLNKNEEQPSEVLDAKRRAPIHLRD